MGTLATLFASTTAFLSAFRNAAIDFWHQHIFDPGIQGATEILWVNYRNNNPAISEMEVHRLTQQAVVPLNGEIIQVVASSHNFGSLDKSSLNAFRIPVGAGICMRPACWHTTRVNAAEVQCLMLTRQSTTIDLAAHLISGTPLFETAMTVVDIRLTQNAEQNLPGQAAKRHE